MPKNDLGSLIDALHKAREKRLAQDRKVAELKEQEALAEVRVIARLQNQGLTKAAGRKASVSLYPKIVAQVDPTAWHDVFAFVVKHDAWDLLQKRINNAAFRDRVENGVTVPGTKAVSVMDLSIRKIA